MDANFRIIVTDKIPVHFPNNRLITNMGQLGVN